MVDSPGSEPILSMRSSARSRRTVVSQTRACQFCKPKAFLARILCGARQTRLWSAKHIAGDPGIPTNALLVGRFAQGSIFARFADEAVGLGDLFIGGFLIGSDFDAIVGIDERSACVGEFGGKPVSRSRRRELRWRPPVPDCRQKGPIWAYHPAPQHHRGRGCFHPSRFASYGR